MCLVNISYAESMQWTSEKYITWSIVAWGGHKCWWTSATIDSNQRPYWLSLMGDGVQKHQVSLPCFKRYSALLQPWHSFFSWEGNGFHLWGSESNHYFLQPCPCKDNIPWLSQGTTHFKEGHVPCGTLNFYQPWPMVMLAGSDGSPSTSIGHHVVCWFPGVWNHFTNVALEKYIHISFV